MSLTALRGVEHPLISQLRAGPPVLPPVQLRVLLSYGRRCGWSFDWAWKWSFEAIRWPHDTAERREWKLVLGGACDDSTLEPSRQRNMWRRAYERSEHQGSEQGGSALLIAA